MQPISPHQTHSLGLSVNTNTQTQRLNEGAMPTHTLQINKIEGKNKNILKQRGGCKQKQHKHHIQLCRRKPGNASVLLRTKQSK